MQLSVVPYTLSYKGQHDVCHVKLACKEKWLLPRFSTRQGERCGYLGQPQTYRLPGLVIVPECAGYEMHSYPLSHLSIVCVWLYISVITTA